MVRQEGDDPAAMLQPVGAQEAASHQLVVEPRVPPPPPTAAPCAPPTCARQACCSLLPPLQAGRRPLW